MSLTGLKQTLDSESIKAHNYCRNIALLNKLFYIIEFFLEYFLWKQLTGKGFLMK